MLFDLMEYLYVREINHLLELNSLIFQVKPLIKGAIQQLSVLEYFLHNYSSLTSATSQADITAC